MTVPSGRTATIGDPSGAGWASTATPGSPTPTGDAAAVAVASASPTVNTTIPSSVIATTVSPTVVIDVMRSASPPSGVMLEPSPPLARPWCTGYLSSCRRSTSSTTRSSSNVTNADPLPSVDTMGATSSIDVVLGERGDIERPHPQWRRLPDDRSAGDGGDVGVDRHGDVVDDLERPAGRRP